MLYFSYSFININKQFGVRALLLAVLAQRGGGRFCGIGPV